MSEKPKKALPRWRNILEGIVKTVLKASLAVAVVGYLIWKNSDKLGTTFREINYWWLLPAILLYLLHLLANAWRWWLLLRIQKINCTLWGAVSLTFQSLFFSLVMPGGAIGGDVVRAGFLAAKVPKGRKFDGVFTILIDRFTGMIGVFSVALGMLPFTWNYVFSDSLKQDMEMFAKHGLEINIEMFIWMLLAGAAAGLLASVLLFKHHSLEKIPLFLRLTRLADRLTRGFYTRVSQALDSYRNNKKELFICILSSVVLVNLNLGFVAYFVSLSVAGTVTSFAAALAAITIGNLAGLLPLFPSGIGARDIFVIAILMSAGMSGDEASASSLIITLMIVLFNVSGGLLFVFDKSNPVKKEDIESGFEIQPEHRL